MVKFVDDGRFQRCALIIASNPNPSPSSTYLSNSGIQDHSRFLGEALLIAVARDGGVGSGGFRRWQLRVAVVPALPLFLWSLARSLLSSCPLFSALPFVLLTHRFPPFCFGFIRELPQFFQISSPLFFSSSCSCLALFFVALPKLLPPFLPLPSGFSSLIFSLLASLAGSLF